MPELLQRSGIYLGWVGFANLGDEAMWEACRNVFPRHHWITMSDLTVPIGVSPLQRMSHDPAWLLRILVEEMKDPERTRKMLRRGLHHISGWLTGEAGLLGGGTFVNRNDSILDAYRCLTRRVHRPVPTFGTGVANSRFWRSTPGWTDRRNEWVELLRELPEVGVRGPLSRDELADAGLTNVVVSGDPALLLHQTLVSRLPRERLTVVINYGEPAGGMIGSKKRMAAYLAEFARATARRHHVKIIPVWPKDVNACQNLAVRAGLATSAVTVACTRHTEYMKEMADTDLLIAFKLHAGILAATCNVPFCLIEYQPKCRDFMQSVGCDDHCLLPQECVPERLRAFVECVETNGEAWRAANYCKIAQMKKTFEAYCNRITPLLY